MRTPRDLEATLFLSRCGEAPSSQVAVAVGFPSARLVARRLRILEQQGLVASRPAPRITPGAASKLWRLTDRGAREILGEGARAPRFTGGFSSTQHRTGTTEAVMLFGQAAHSVGWQAYYLFELEARRRCVEEKFKPVPDAVFALVDPGRARGSLMYLEIDLGTEPLVRKGAGSCVASKVADYERLLSRKRLLVPDGSELVAHFETFRVLFVTTSSARQSSFQELLRTKARKPDLFWSTTLGQLRTGVLAPVWMRGTEARSRPLVAGTPPSVTGLVTASGSVMASVPNDTPTAVATLEDDHPF